MKPKAPIPPKPKMSEEERKEQMTRAFLQKRASLAEGILFNLCQGVSVIPRDEEINLLVDRSVEMADRLMEKLYGAKPQEEKPKEKTPAEKERECLKGNLKEEVCASEICAYRGKNVCTIKRNEYCPMFKPKEYEFIEI